MLFAMKLFLAIGTHRRPVCDVLCLLLLGVAVLAQKDVPTCYYPNGALAQGDYACNLSADHSACCSVGSICLDNGICGVGNGKIIRGSCTDQSWGSPGCPQYCLDASTGGTDLIPCENVTSNPLDFCCDHNTFCCDVGAGRFRLDSVGEPTRTLSSAASTATRIPKTSTSTSTTSSKSTRTTSTSEATTALPSPPASAPTLIPDPPLSSPGLSTGAKVGIGIGAALGAIIVLAAIFFLWKRRRTSRPKPAAQHDGAPFPHNDKTQNGMYAGPAAAQNGSYYGSGLYEMSGEQHRELSGKPQYEMPAGNHHPAREMPG